MKVFKFLIGIVISVAIIVTIITFFSNRIEQDSNPSTNHPVDTIQTQVDTTQDDVIDPADTVNQDNTTNDDTVDSMDDTTPDDAAPNDEHKGTNDTKAVEVNTHIDSVAVMVNPDYLLPEDYVPSDLVYPNVRFTFDDMVEKRMLRQAAATALEEMFEAAEVDGVYLAGVSAYRSYKTQEALFNRYVKRDGYEKAKTYSAEPGTSEHQTGLSIDISGSTGKCAAQDCFGGTVEAIWLENNAANYGFIIRYPKGKEDITGYKYEPWHMRYVGVDIALDIASQELTLEEYYNVAPIKK